MRKRDLVRRETFRKASYEVKASGLQFSFIVLIFPITWRTIKLNHVKP